MQSIQFSLVSCKVYNNDETKAVRWVRGNRLVTYYEFEFYTEDSLGGVKLDNTFYPAAKGYCCMAKPGQRMWEAFPRKCLYINIETQDEALCRAFNRLPTHFPVENFEKIQDLLGKIIALNEAGGIHQQLQRQGYACQMISALVDYGQGGGFDRPDVRRHEKLLIAVDKYMRENIDQDLQLADFAQFCSMDPTYFHKLFKAAMGRTPAKQLLHYRISAARLALQDSRLRLEEIAQQCGFSSVSYFCTKFRQVTGMTPMQYRNTAGR